MKVNIHVLAEMITDSDPSILNVHTVNMSDDSEDIVVTYDVIVPAKEITISKEDYLAYARNRDIDSLIGTEEA